MTQRHVRPGVRRSRSVIDAEVCIRTPVRQWTAAVLDVSLSGIRIGRPVGFDLEHAQIADLALSSPGQVTLSLRGRVVRDDEQEIAFRFEPLSPPQESALRELIERRGQLRDDFDDFEL